MATETKSCGGVRVATRCGVTVIVAELYIWACLLPVIYLDDGVPRGDLDFKLGSPPGVVLLLVGWAGLTLFPWLANLCLLIGAALWLADRERGAWWWARLAVVLALSSWFFVWPFKPHRLLLGYYLWQWSTLLLAAAAWWAVRRAEQ
jgi:hypothetical protein